MVLPGTWSGTRYKATSCPQSRGRRSLRLRDHEALPAARDGMVVGVADLAFGELGEGALVVVRHHLHELRQQRLPVLEDARRDRRAGALGVLGDEGPHRRDVLALEGVETDELHVAALREVPVLIEDVRDPAAHPGGEVAAGGAENDDAAAGHVLAAMIADPFDDGR